MNRRALRMLGLCLGLVACGGGEEGPEDGGAPVDASDASVDAGPLPSDAGTDAGSNGNTDAGSSGGPNATVAGAVSLPYPTLHHLTVEWPFTGDANANGAVTVRYRAAGSGTWRESMPLRRVPAGQNEGFNWASRHTGSVFGLQPGTAYELELTLTDPEGGTVTRTASATTRAVPAPMVGAPVKAVTPATFTTVAASAQPGSFNGYSSGSGRVLALADLVPSGSSMDHDGLGSTTGTFTGNWGGTSFNSLSALRTSTSEKNAVQVDLGGFAATVAWPAAPMTKYAAPDLRLRSGSAAENAGQAIPGITDGFSGSAPDLGAYEAGTALPVYGPRS
jgi:hypothetical protein